MRTQSDGVTTERNRIADAVTRWAGDLEELAAKQKAQRIPQHVTTAAYARAMRFVLKVIIGAPVEAKELAT